MKFLSLLFLLLISISLYSQDYRKLQQLRKDISEHPADTSLQKVLFNRIIKEKGSMPNDSLLAYNLMLYESSISAGYQKLAALVAVNIGNEYNTVGNYPKALNYLFSAEKIFMATSNFRGLASVYNLIGNTYIGTGYYEGQKIYFSKCYEVGLKHNLLLDKAYGAGGLGTYYSAKEEYRTAIKWTLIAGRLFKENNSNIGYTICLVNIASYYRKLDEIQKAEEFIKLAYENLPQTNFSYASFLCYTELGDINSEKENYEKAIENYKLALNIILLDKANHNISEVYKALSEASIKAKQYAQAVDYLKLHIQYRDSVFNENSNKQIVEVKEKYETEKKDAEIKILNKQNDLNTSELNRKKIIIYSSIGFTVLVLVMFSFVINSNVRKNKTNALLEKQNIIIEEKQKEIVDSITYAKRIQYTLLANQDVFNTFLPGHFIFFEPKDIVSGDFYWITHKDNFIYLAVCDCTGHGVPGAFMSLLSSNFLNEAVNEKSITDPAHVLNYVREKLINNLDGGNDGMDAILVKFPDTISTLGATAEAEIQYASANNKLIMVRDNILKEFETDKMPVGKGERTGSFAMHSVQVKKNDVLYLYTDGYADQFGGEKGKKFKYKSLNQLLASINTFTGDEQKEIIRNKFVDWKGKLEQVDDVLIIGIRL